MQPEEFSYGLLVREYGFEEVVFRSPQHCAAFLLTIGDALLRGFGVISSGDVT